VRERQRIVHHGSLHAESLRFPFSVYKDFNSGSI
jgi:hypothetical protein